MATKKYHLIVIGAGSGELVAAAGAAGRTIRLSDPQTWLDIKVWGPFVLVLLLSLLPKFFKKTSK